MTQNRKGFTLIEVVVVAVVIGVLAAVAVPRLAASKDKAYVAAMKADLHTIAIYEEQFAADNHGQYFGGTATTDSPLNGFTPSKDVTVTLVAFNILGSQLADWTATVKHSQTSQSCEMRAGEITCTTGNALTTGILPP
ncbi:MAG TPA: prepilin-type N-terminal cleavage/methylation domain-containing protein [Gemmatimonadaceae bacterium]|jgi:prepilin-type N-terminal cleavage/methylation domain-containing protein